MDASVPRKNEYDRIGGFLWVLGIGVVINVFISAYIALKAPTVGVVALALSLLLAWAFWSRKKIFPYTYVVVQIANTALFMNMLDPHDVGKDLVMPIVFAVYLFVGKRPRGTFTRPLNSRSMEQ